MADSSVAIVSGGGTLIDARTNAGGDYRQVIIIGDQTANDAIAVVTSADAGVQTSEYGMVVRPLMTDAGKLRVSSFGTLSAFINEGAVSATLRAGTANIGYVSSYLDNGSVSAMQSAAGNLRASAFSNDGGLMRVSSVQDGAAALNVSAKSDSAALFRVSAALFPDTVGGLTAFRSLNLSASQAVKGSAGALYGYYLWNTSTTPQYIKFTNTSGAINVGTDVPVFGAMLPASAAANVWFGNGIKGFTAGIGVHATSAVADNATTAAAASAVGGTIFYN